MGDQPKYVICIGTSAGGLHALPELIRTLPDDIDAAIFIVLHLSSKGISSYLVNYLKPHTTLECLTAVNEMPVEKGHIYVAPPDQHLVIKRGKIIVGDGAKENRWRPSIDVLFRSAAASYNARAIGIVLTGLLDDGTAGMQAIKRSGGITIVQDPNEAEYPDMPLSVLNAMEVNYCVKLSEIAPILAMITQLDRPETPPPPDVISESEIAEKAAIGIPKVASLGEHSIYSCPDCGGGLWQITNDNITRYRCHVGHSFSERDLMIKQAETLETTLWVALRMMEERRNLLKRMKGRHHARGLHHAADDHQEKIEAISIHIDRLKELLFATRKAEQREAL